MNARRGKLIIHGDQARAALIRGLDLVADAVAPTLGPAGSHVVLQRHDAGPLVTNDGVTIARAIELLRDPYTNQGVQLLREVAGITDTAVGDGTTTAVIIARELIRRSFAAGTRGYDRSAISAGLDRGCAIALDAIGAAAQELRDDEELVAVAANAARDRGIGELVASALGRAGHDGVVQVQDDRAYGLRLEFADGMSFSSGLLAPELATHPAEQLTRFQRPLILLANERISQISQLAPALQLVAAQRRPLALIADEVSGDALTLLILNVRRRTIPAVAVKAPMFGDDRLAMLEDIAALTGGRVCGPAGGRSTSRARLSDLGEAEAITVTRERTTITSGGGDPTAIAERLAGIEAELGRLESEYERDKRRLRRACLGGTVATIKVGLDTVVEQEETRLRIVDAIRSGRAALRSGVVPGAGATLIRAADAIAARSGSLEPGAEILARALEAPLRSLAANAGLDPVLAVRSVRAAPTGHGLDLASGGIVDLRRAGIVDAADVVRTALRTAVSIARTTLLTETIIAHRPLPPPVKRPYGHHHGHDHGHFGAVPHAHEHTNVAHAHHGE